jgi:hypothetical protein
MVYDYSNINKETFIELSKGYLYRRIMLAKVYNKDINFIKGYMEYINYDTKALNNISKFHIKNRKQQAINEIYEYIVDHSNNKNVICSPYDLFHILYIIKNGTIPNGSFDNVAILSRYIKFDDRFKKIENQTFSVDTCIFTYDKLFIDPSKELVNKKYK